MSINDFTTVYFSNGTPSSLSELRQQIEGLKAEVNELLFELGRPLKYEIGIEGKPYMKSLDGTGINTRSLRALHMRAGISTTSTSRGMKFIM